MKITPIVLTLALSAVACRKHTMTVSAVPASSSTLVAGTFIDLAGTYTHTVGQNSRQLIVASGSERVSWTIDKTHHSPRGSSSESQSDSFDLGSPGAPWFIFVESHDHLWFFNGTDSLHYSIPRANASDSGPAIVAGQLRPNAPPIPLDLIPRLPAELRQLLPAAEVPGSRPSF